LKIIVYNILTKNSVKQTIKALLIEGAGAKRLRVLAAKVMLFQLNLKTKAANTLSLLKAPTPSGRELWADFRKKYKVISLS
jgi:hypothetical protein